MFRLLFVSLLAGLWQSLEVVQCQNPPTGIPKTSYCYNTSSGKTCFTTTVPTSKGGPVRKPFKVASDWCKVHDPGSSLIVIDSLESKGYVERFIGREVLMNETIVIDARKLSTSESLKWSWVNGHHTVPTDVTQNATEFHDGACVESNPGQPVTFCLGNTWTLHRFICEYSESISHHSHRQNNKSYVASEAAATWYDARNECLRLGGDLASVTDLRTIGNWSRLIENERYWIGLHRNKWIWNSTGGAITYTNWEGGFPDNSNDRQCVCISPSCRGEKNETICENNRKWWTCNCNNNYAIVCQTDVFYESGDNISRQTDSATKAKEEPITTTTSTVAPIPSTKFTTVPPFKPVIHNVTSYSKTLTGKATGDVSSETRSTPSMNQNHFSASQTTVFSPSSTGLHTGIILSIILSVLVIFIIVAVIFMIRKRKYDRRNETSPMGNTSRVMQSLPNMRPWFQATVVCLKILLQLVTSSMLKWV